MPIDVFPKFMEKEGYWFNIRKHEDGSFSIFNTQRKRNQLDRDGIGYDLGETFKTLEEAKIYLDNIEK